MAPRRASNVEKTEVRRPPATTLDGRENQMVGLAVDLAEKQIREGTASAAVITHYLKLGTSREKLERDKLKAENELLKARVEALASQSRVEELYAKAIHAMANYAGGNAVFPDEDYED